ncbi:MAG TPA: hypothetical protein VJL29_09155 [Thermoguttaceae bacterium]|nr:hypothetical protein [Thermoguttaceae bacterium]
MSRYERFDRTRIELGDLAARGNDLRAEDCLPLAPPEQPYVHPEFDSLVARIREARAAGRPVIVMTGAHPIKLGLSRFLVDLVERRIITHLGTNGAGLVHDFELASFGGTSENVARWIREGRFGLWRETGRLNDLIVEAAARDEGLGEGVGRAIVETRAAHAELSLAAAGWRAGVPVTAHVAIGCDIIHSHANCNAEALGRTTYNDFLIFVQSVLNLEGGVFLNIGTSTIGPEVYLKALSMARNVARQRGESITRFTTAVFDLAALPDDWREGPPSKSHPQYYYRPWKTILHRTVADGGESFYFSGDHARTIPTLWRALVGDSIRTGDAAPDAHCG